jgi:hypothetical protein
MLTLRNILGDELEDNFMDFDLTEIQKVLSQLKNDSAIDLPHAEMLQQKSLYGADILTQYLAKIIKTVSYLETKVNSTRNKVSLEYKSPDGSKITADMRKWAADCSSEVEEIQIRLAKAKGSKAFIEKKYDILIKSHHHYKDIAMGLRKTILGYHNPNTSEEKLAEGWG